MISRKTIGLSGLLISVSVFAVTINCHNFDNLCVMLSDVPTEGYSSQSYQFSLDSNYIVSVATVSGTATAFLGN